MNKHEIMKKAHLLAARSHRAAIESGRADSYSVTFGICLRLVWAEAKGGEKAPRSGMKIRDMALAAMTEVEKDGYIDAAISRMNLRRAA